MSKILRLHKPPLAFLIVLMSLTAFENGGAQNSQAPTDEFSKPLVPEVEVQKEDYTRARRGFRTKLIRNAPALPPDWTPPQPPEGTAEVLYQSGPLSLKAWINRPADNGNRRRVAVLFLHSAFFFRPEFWEMSKPYRDAGFIVMTPLLRGENGQAGRWTMFYDEVDDVVAAAEYLRKQSFVDPDNLYIAGHSNGGTLAMLAAMTYQHFRAAASFSGSPDQVLFCRHFRQKDIIPFDYTDQREIQLRSPLAYAASFKCPTRIYFGREESNILSLTSQRTAEIARGKRLDVQAMQVEGGHVTGVPEEIRLSIQFFRQHGR
jgi:hypothetical protein